MNSKAMRNDPLFTRNAFRGQGKWNIPLVRAQEININNLPLLACSDTKKNDTLENRRRGVHFFVDDYRFTGVYLHPERTLEKYAQYAFLLTPDFSTYVDMGLWRQIESVAQNRWIGAYWQSKGLCVVPTISWSTAQSYEFCFDGVEKGSVVAVSTIGCRRARTRFMRGYDTMCKRLEPKKVICFGDPFPEMSGSILAIDYNKSRKKVR